MRHVGTQGEIDWQKRRFLGYENAAAAEDHLETVPLRL